MPGEPSSPRPRPSNTEIDPRLYQVLYEVEIRMTEKMADMRGQIKGDMVTAITLALAPIDARLQEGTRIFQEQASRLDAHSDFIDDVRPLIEKLKSRKETSAIERKADTSGWISVDKLPAIITAIGSLIAVVISSVALLGRPVQAPPTQSSQPTTTTPASGP